MIDATASETHQFGRKQELGISCVKWQKKQIFDTITPQNPLVCFCLPIRVFAAVQLACSL